MIRFTTATRLASEVYDMNLSCKETLMFIGFFLLSNILFFGGIAVMLALAIFGAFVVLTVGALVFGYGGLIGSIAFCVMVFIEALFAMSRNDKKYLADKGHSGDLNAILLVFVLAFAIMGIAGALVSYSRGNLELLPVLFSGL